MENKIYKVDFSFISTKYRNNSFSDFPNAFFLLFLLTKNISNQLYM